MLQGLIIKKVMDLVLKKIMEKYNLNELQTYVEEDNILDKQMNQVQKNISKHGRVLEYIEKDIAKLKVNSHPPVFMKDDYKDILKRLNKLEKEK